MTTPNTAVAATTPYALVRLGEHIVAHRLPVPESIDITKGVDRVLLWLSSAAAPAWVATLNEVTTHTPAALTLAYRDHTVTGVLDGSGVRVRLRWMSSADHKVCESDDCDAVICYDPDGPCQGTVAPGCTHLAFVCEDHRHDCVECRIDLADDGGRV